MKSSIIRAAVATRGLASGLPTAVLSLFAIALIPLLVPATPFAPGAMRPVRALADRERSRLSAAGPPLARPYRSGMLTDPATWRDLAWLALNGVGWTISALLVIALWPGVLISLLMPVYWRFFPPGSFSAMLILVRSWPQALTLPVLQAICYAAILFILAPAMLSGWSRLNRALLRPTEHAALTGEVQRLTRTRTAALESHGAELRRIERDLHDGVQAHLVSISVRLGLADRALPTSPEQAQPLIRDARTGIEEVLADLRGIIRGIYPPILTDRGLVGAVHSLASGRDFPVAVRMDDDLRRPPAPVEAAAYFVIAETLTNASKHSVATRAEVIVTRVGDDLLIRVDDDGRGGAEETLGTGLSGIRRRVAALDGTFSLSSPPGLGTTIEVSLPCGS